MNYNLNVKNLFVGANNNGLVVVDIEQKEENGIYTLEHSFTSTFIEKKEKVDIREEVWHYYQDAMHDGYKAMRVLEWLDDLCCSLDELPEKIASKCEHDNYYRDDIMWALGIETEKYDSSEIIATCEDNNGDEYMLIHDGWMQDLSDIWKTNIESNHMIKLFSYLTVYGEKPYGESIAREICELVEKLNNYDIDEHFQAYVDHGMSK